MSSESFTKAWPDLRQRILEIVESGHSAAVELLLDKHPGLRAHEQLLIGCIYSEFCLQSRQHYRDRDEWSNGNQTATTFRTSAQSNDNIS